jgi:hypothetical protein
MIVWVIKIGGRGFRVWIRVRIRMFEYSLGRWYILSIKSKGIRANTPSSCSSSCSGKWLARHEGSDGLSRKLDVSP